MTPPAWRDQTAGLFLELLFQKVSPHAKHTYSKQRKNEVIVFHSVFSVISINKYDQLPPKLYKLNTYPQYLQLVINYDC